MPQVNTNSEQLRRAEEHQRKQEIYQRYQRAIDRRIAGQQAFLKEREQKNLVNQKGGVESALMAQEAAAQERRDAQLHGYGQQDANRRAGINADASAQQFGYATSRDKQHQADLLKRDAVQQDYQKQRDNKQNDYTIQRDERQQGYTQQNMYQRETADISAKWQDQIQQSRNNGMDFSEKQQQEMNVLDEAFRKNVLNNPNLDEGLKQRAMLEHQRKLSSIVPNEKVQKPEDGLNQSVIFHEPTKSWFRVGRDSHGFPTYEPLGGGSGGGGPKPVDPEKQAAEQRNNMLKREETLIKLDKEIRSEIDPETDTPKFKTQDEIDEEKLKRLAPYERFYTESGLPPHELYQLKAKRDDLKAIEKQQRDAKTLNMADSLRLRSGDSEFNPAAQAAYEGDPAPAQQSPVPVSSTNIDDQLKKTESSGDKDAAAALQTIKLLTEKYAGAPPQGTRDDAAFTNALRTLETKGISIDGQKRQNVPAIFDVGSPAF